MKNFFVAAIAALSTVIMPGSAFAVDITLDDASGFWDNAVGGSNVLGEGTSTLSWGAATNPNRRSSYVYNDLTPQEFVDAPPAFGPDAIIAQAGTFTHNNRIIPANTTSITATELILELVIEGQTISPEFVFRFSHLETPNNQNPCPDPPGGSNPCPDLVTIEDIIFEDIITIGGINYDLTLFFSDDALNFTRSFVTAEGLANTIGLYVVLAPQFEPPIAWQSDLATAGGALMLGGLAYSRLRKNKLTV
jgi:hypothetical protein